jgi:hypothetical protein
MNIVFVGWLQVPGYSYHFCGKVIVGLVVAGFLSVTTSEGVDIPSPGWFA